MKCIPSWNNNYYKTAFMAKILPYYFLHCFLSLMVQNNAVNIFTQQNDESSSYLDPEIVKSCPEDGTMFIKGKDVKLSDFVRRNGNIYNLCSYNIELKYINVFALNSLVIDRDVDVSGSQLTLFFIAPTWVVVGNRKIAVDGSKGDYIPRAADGNYTNIDGQDGKPGLPGGPGGNFFGIGDSFVNGKSLTITANGGIGGSGQYGGNGYDQIKARYVDIKVLGKIWCGLYYDICRGKEKKYQLNLQDNYGNFSDFYCQGLYEENNMVRCSYKIFGWEGKEGGKGGNGGRGGKGGLPGNIKLLDLSNSSQIPIYSILGIYGQDGVGGIGGKSGENGHNVIYKDVYFLAPPKIMFEVGQEYDYRLGPNGSDGCNSVHYIEDLATAYVLKPYEILNIVNEYKSWLRQSSVHMKKVVVTFYKHIDENSYIRNLYNASEFLSEVDSIDEEFHKLKSTVDFIPFYESLLERIYFYVEKYKKDKSRDEDRTILKVLYTEILGKVYNLNEHAETYLAIEILPYLESVREKLEKVSFLIKENSKFNIIVDEVNELNKYKENYEIQVQKLITKSRQYMDSKIGVDWETLMNDETEKISKLVTDIIRFKEIPINYEQEILRWGKKLQDSLIVRSNLYFIKLINSMFSALSDFAEIVSSLVEIGAEVPAVLRLGDKTTAKTEFSPEAIENLHIKIEAIKTEEVSEINTLLQSILNKTKINPDVLFDLTEEVLIIHKKLQNNYRFLTVNALRSDLLQSVKIKIDELLSINLNPSGNIGAKAYAHIITARSAFNDMSRIITINTLSRGFVDLYKEYQDDDTKLDIINEYISKAHNILHIEKKHEDVIYGMVYQLLQNIQDSIILNPPGDADTVSKLAIEVGKWNIPLILDNIKKKTKLFTGSFQAQSYYLMEIIENLGVASSTLAGVFERIKNYFQQKQLETHCADTNYAVNKGIKFTNRIYEKKFQTIKKGLSSHLVLLHYKKAANTFKQYVFPIADFYFKDIILPSHFNIYDDISDIVSMAITQIDIMMEKVEHYKASMLSGDGIMARKDFGGRQFGSENPLFVWTSEQYNDIIANLMTGNQVMVNAEINKTHPKEHAIKFNNIDFYFKSNNESVQERVNHTMAYFEISALHMGNSHYRYGEEMYFISSDDLKMSYYFENDESSGEPIFTGGVYEFVKNVDITLSPYALWQISLTELDEGVSFADLLVFKDYVNLEMGGNCFYISKEKISTLDLKVDKYYKPVDN